MTGSITLRVSGDYACFTRPEFKVERVSYEVPTPSAAVGMLSAVLWKPEMRWVVRRIDVLRPVRWAHHMRNEVGCKISGIACARATVKGEELPLQIIEDERQQRHARVLRDVDYLIHADIELTQRAAGDDSVEKYQAMYRRRVRKGACFSMPYLGCREYAAAAFDDGANAPPPIKESRDLGMMLLKIAYSERRAEFFHAQMINGTIEIPNDFG